MEEQSKYIVDVDEEEIETTINADWLATEVASIIYNQGKAKIFNVLESQLEEGSKLDAVKNITQNIVAEIARNASDLVKDILDDWEQKVFIPTESGLTEEEEEEFRKEYEEVEKIIK